MKREHDFNTIADIYERLVLKEEKLHRQAETCKDIIERNIQSLLAKGTDYECETVEALLMALQGVQARVLAELSEVSVKKGLQAFKMWQVQREEKG